MPNGGFLRVDWMHVLEVHEHALGGLRAQVDLRALRLHRAHVGLEHQVEVARLGQVAAAHRADQRGVGVAALRGHGLAQMVLAEAPLALAEALHQRVGEALQVARGLPRARVHQDRGVQGHDVVAAEDHRPPPLALDVGLQQHAVVAVVVGRGQPAVDLRGREHEATPLAQGDDLVHGHGVGGVTRAPTLVLTSATSGVCPARAPVSHGTVPASMLTSALRPVGPHRRLARVALHRRLAAGRPGAPRSFARRVAPRRTYNRRPCRSTSTAAPTGPPSRCSSPCPRMR